jgi:hypothetical protein
MADYIWQLGIDWNAIQTGGVSYLRGGLVSQANDEGLPGTAPVQIGNTLKFQILDVSSSGGPKVATIGSFVILTQAAVKDQPYGKGLSSLQPTIALDSTTAQSTLFSNVLGSWTSEEVTVTVKKQGDTEEPTLSAPLRFLLTTQIQAIGTDGVVRLFSHDPEMVVGSNG